MNRAIIAASAVPLLFALACGGGASGATDGDNTQAGATEAANSGVDSDGIVVRMDGESVDDYVARLYEAAQEEGTAVYYTPAQEREIETFSQYWEETFPEVELDVVGAPTDTILQRALVECRSGNVQDDTYQGSSSEMVVLEEEGCFTMYRTANEEFVPDELKFPDRPFVNTYYTSFHVVYNTDSVDPSELPDDFQGFTEPRWRGEIAMDQNAVEFVAGLIQSMGEEEAIELLRGFVANDLRLVEGTTLRTELLSAGEFDVMLDGYGHSSKRFVDEGAPVAAMVPHPEPLTRQLSFVAIMEEAPHPNAARLLAEFVQMPEGQQTFRDQNKAGARVEGDIVAPYEEFFEGVEPIVLDPDTDFDVARRVLEDIVVRGG